MKRMRKYIALFLILSMSLSTSTMAAPQLDVSDISAQMQTEVQTMVQSRLEQVEHLFDGKDPGYLNAYKKYLTALYEHVILAERGIVPMYEERYRLDNGGAAMYTTIDAGGDHFDVIVLMFNKEDSYDFLLENWSPGGVDLGDLLIDVLGYVPALGTFLGTVFNILDGVSAVSGANEWQSIQDADGYVLAEVVHAREYPGDPVTLIRGWDTHPYYVPWSSLPDNIDIEVTEFD